MRTASRQMDSDAPSTSEVCAVVVTLDPGPGFEEVAGAIIPQVGRLVVVDNGSGPDLAPLLEGVEQRHGSRVAVLRNGENVGLAAALNAGVRRAEEEGFRWILTLDHDSVAAPGMVSGLLATARDVAAENPGIVCAMQVDRASGRRYRYPSYGRLLFRHREPGERPLPVSFCMTSGSLVSRAVFERTGPFREDYFVYAVDNEFCRRVRRNGFTIWVSDRAVLYHREGGPRGSAGAPDWGERSLYYIFRNMTFGMRHETAAAERIHDILFLLKTFGAIFRGERPRKRGRAAAALRGIADGVRGRLGRSTRYS